MRILNQLFESFLLAWQSVIENVLRTTLSLLGVAIGVFSIITALTIVDSLKLIVSERLETFGVGTVYVTKFPWVFEDDFQWWKYFQRPALKYREFQHLKAVVQSSKGLAIVDGKSNVTARRLNNSMKVRVTGVSYDYNKISNVPILSGRYFTEQECERATSAAIIGADLVANLFSGSDAIGQRIKIKNHSFTVIATLSKTGTNLLDIGQKPDSKIFIPYTTFSKTLQGSFREPMLIGKALATDIGEFELEADLKGGLRSLRSISPIQSDNFSINRPDAITKALGGIFTALTTAGWVVSLFSILIGGFGIANIMFVSVTERRNIIGIQKALGAKQYLILFQFLCEAVLLSLLGGVIGISMVAVISFYPQDMLPLVISKVNIIIGFMVATMTGVLAGIIPAYQATSLDPVVAMRAK